VSTDSLSRPYVLGLDLGVRSVGWAILDLDGEQPVSLRACGVRCFEAGVEGDVESGRDEAPGAKRRQARGTRRQLFRRGQRRRQLLPLLWRHGLLPPLALPPGGSIRDGGSLAAYFERFDADLARRHAVPGDDRAQQVLFYRLRALALDQPLALHDLGRVLYQLAQRRGFLSNRKPRTRDRDDAKELGKVESGIDQLTKALVATRSRTLGEYFAGLDPHRERVRRRWTARAMYRQELEAIWASQARFHPELTAELGQELLATVFFQRPLRSQKGRVGFCELVPRRRRAPLACREAQELRLLAAVNNLRLTLPTGEVRGLEPDERTRLVAVLARQGEMKFTALRKLLGLPKTAQVNLERGGETILGHRTDAKLAKVFGPRWDALDEAAKDTIVQAILGANDPQDLVPKGERDWGLAHEAAVQLGQLSLEPGYAAFSREAIRRLLPGLREGVALETARRAAFPGVGEASTARERLPSLHAGLPELRNPAVARVLTELRKVVNALIRRYGKPERIRIELGRDLRNSREHRKELHRRNQNREAERARVREILQRDHRIAQPSRQDIEKYQLGVECGWICPYTGHPIPPSELFGETPQFDVEHIWPFSRSLDDSFINKTLCHAPENRDRKRNQTPREAYGDDAQRWEEIKARVEAFQGPLRLAKLSRFVIDAIPQDFTSRQLNDTRYASRLALRFLSELYGGTFDAGGTQRIRAGAGGLTAIVRNELGLNRILGDGGTKSRDDHRHHAVDAVAIALLDDGLVQRLQTAACAAPAARRRRFAPIEPPWPGFFNEVQEAIARVVVSHRPRRKVSGALHEETLYSRPLRRGTETGIRRVRKLVWDLKPNQVASITDPAVRAAVEAKLAEVGGVFKRLENDPPLFPHAERPMPIRKVRLEVRESPRAIGRGGRQRHVLSAANHHLAVVAVLGPNGEEVAWEGHSVTLLEASRRLAAREPVVKRDFGPGRRFKFTLTEGDVIEVGKLEAERALFRVRSAWLEKGNARVSYCPLADARLKADQQAAGAFVRTMLTGLFRLGCRKVEVTPLGEVHPRND
jgi:CRISPR-associated endonuclease Csn1